MQCRASVSLNAFNLCRFSFSIDISFEHSSNEFHSVLSWQTFLAVSRPFLPAFWLYINSGLRVAVSLFRSQAGLFRRGHLPTWSSGTSWKPLSGRRSIAVPRLEKPLSLKLVDSLCPSSAKVFAGTQCASKLVLWDTKKVSSRLHSLGRLVHVCSPKPDLQYNIGY